MNYHQYKIHSKTLTDRNPRETAAQGGVIGEDGMFKGEDMGN